MRPWLEHGFANPSSDHAAGRAARGAVEEARREVAALIHAEPASVLWTSGATESINLAIKGVLAFHGGAPAHLVSSRIEHRATLDTLRALESQGHRVTLIRPDAQGRIGLDAVLEALTPETRLVSLMWVNNEIGTVTDIPAIANALRARGVLLHVDAAQAAGWLAIDVQSSPIDLLSLSAHKLGGPKGVGALYVCRRPRVRLSPLLHGGGQEQGMRSGTLAPHQLVGFAAAGTRRRGQREALFQSVGALRERLWQEIVAAAPQVRRNSPEDGAPHILNISVPDVDGESLRALLPDLLVSSGSACSSATREPSFVLRALGHSDALADASLRFSLGEGSVLSDVLQATRRLAEAVHHLHALDSADWAVSEISALDNVFEYRDPVWRRFLAPRHGRPLEQFTHHAEARSRADGARVVVRIRLDDGVIAAVSYGVRGCPGTVAAAEWLAEQLSGQPVSMLDQNWVTPTLAALEIGPEKSHCAVMMDDVTRALSAQIDNRGVS